MTDQRTDNMMVIRKVLYKEGRKDRRGGTVIDRQTDQGLINAKEKHENI